MDHTESVAEVTGGLLQKYEETTGVQREVIDALVVHFSPVSRYNISRFYQSPLTDLSVSAFQKTISGLVKSGLVVSTPDKYSVDEELSIILLPRLFKKPKYQAIVREIQRGEQYSFNPPVTQLVRDYLFACFVEENKYTIASIGRLMSRIQEAIFLFDKMLTIPAYDAALPGSPALYFRILDTIHLYNILDFKDFRPFIDLLNRQPDASDLIRRMNTAIIETSFQMGKLGLEVKQLDHDPTDYPLLVRSQFELFRGDFPASTGSFEAARKIGRPDSRSSAMEYNLYYEFFYWLNFVFWPEGLNLKKLDAAIKKNNKLGNIEGFFLLTLLYFIKKDRFQANHKLQSLYKFKELAIMDYRSLLFLILHYLLSGRLAEDLQPLTQDLSSHLFQTKRFLFLREVILMARQSDIELDPAILSQVQSPDDPPCLMSRLLSQEKWEEMLEGLMNVARGQVQPGKKESVNARICYLMEMNHGAIQPIQQTMNARGIWSSGRNISLKRFKDQTVEGQTDQDRKLASAITHLSGYYHSSEYSLDFKKGVVELCGHPYLFLYHQPDISLELIRSEPEMFTEQMKTGIKLRTNITQYDQSLLIIKENQTRYKVILLSPQQQSIIRMISEGVTIPERGKKKLLETVTGLSGLITVHSDLVQETASARTVEGDSRIRVQILPFGDGLRAEGFVKPLGSTPPYVKPGKGGKVVYGQEGGEKLQVIRDFTAEKSHAETLSSAISWVMEADIFAEPVHFSDHGQILELLDILNNYTDIARVEWPEGEKFGVRKSASWTNLSLRIKGRNNWFDLDGDLTIDESTVLSLDELIRLNRKSKGRFIELNPGEFLALAESLKKHLDEMESWVTLNRSGISINRFAAHALDEIAQMAGSYKADKKWKDFHTLIHSNSWSEASIPAGFDGELRPYQEEGYRWMVRLNEWGAGACLADDMGLGKTIQAIAMLLRLSGNGPALVVCPASVISNWGHELASFAPTLNPVFLKQSNRSVAFASLSPRDVLVTSYGLLQTEQAAIEAINWSVALLDEAHAIKNTHTKSSKSAMTIQAGFKLALTGTPIQNHLGELWNLFNFCNPGLLGTLAQFTERYVKDDSAAPKQHLKKLITPFILRRTKNKVLEELPPKTEITYPVQLSDQEMAFYEALRREAVANIEGASGSPGGKHLLALAEITKLRLACCNSTMVNRNIKIPSSKLNSFLEIIEVLRANGHRALVFSQFVMHLSLVRTELDRLGIVYQYLDGSTSLPERERVVKAFQAGSGELFLISLKAGGLGLNLTAADYVVHLDPWWNPAVEDQASDRAHRIGQVKPVTIYRLVTSHTIEEKIVRLHGTKRDLADSLLEGTDLSARLSTADLLEFIREV